MVGKREEGREETKNDGGPGTKKTMMRTYTDRLEVTKITKAGMMQARLKKGSSTPWEFVHSMLLDVIRNAWRRRSRKARRG